jgi:membrane-associated protease RseP (regulator of RpoE activity)
MYLYKTSIGIKFMDRIAKKYPRLLKISSYVIIFTGIVLMAASIYFLIDILKIFMNPSFVKIIKITPITPLIPYIDTIFKVSWLPPLYFTYWIIAIALVAIFHEGFHGIFARFYNVRIKSSGFGFLGPFLAFFVEQDEKQMKKAKPFGQMTIIAAGVFANILLTVIFAILLIWFFNFAYAPSGVIFNDYIYSVAPVSAVAGAEILNQSISIDNVNLTKIRLENKNYFVSDDFFSLNISEFKDSPIKIYEDLPAINAGITGVISRINDQPIKSQADVRKELDKYLPGERITITTINKNKTSTYIVNYEIALGSDPNNATRSVIGIATASSEQSGFRKVLTKVLSFSKNPNVYYQPKIDGDFTIFIYNLLLWLVMINFGVALANMWPVAIFDGGYFFYLLVFSITKNKKIAQNSLKISTTIFLLMIALMMILWAFGMFWKF